jgi:hypothetical protein
MLSRVGITEVIAKHGNEFAVFRSPDTAEQKPGYQQIGVFPTLELAGASLIEC